MAFKIANNKSVNKYKQNNEKKKKKLNLHFFAWRLQLVRQHFLKNTYL
jgi:hypothetical protein